MLSTTCTDFIEELRVYRHEYAEINRLAGMFSRHSLWFERVYAHMRKVILTNRGIQ